MMLTISNSMTIKNIDKIVLGRHKGYSTGDKYARPVCDIKNFSLHCGAYNLHVCGKKVQDT